MTRDEIEAEIEDIRSRRGDTILPRQRSMDAHPAGKATPDVPAVVVTLADGSQVCVRHMSYGVDVDYRERPSHAWSPIQFWGGTVAIQPTGLALLPCERDVGRTDEVRNGSPLAIVRGTAS